MNSPAIPKIAENSFASLGLVRTLAAIEARGFGEPTPVQAMTIPLLLTCSDDLAVQAQTGTGKTAAFALPLIETLVPQTGVVQAIILAPTRELAVQICEEIRSLGGKSGLTALPVYGGQPMTEQLRQLKRGVDIVVGTPGRVMDHLRRGSLSLAEVRYLILDEADEMLDRGFVDDIETILKSAGSERRILLFSATMGPAVMGVAGKHLRNAQTLRAGFDEAAGALTEQIYIELDERDRTEALCRLIDMADDFYGLVFCRTRADVDDLAARLFKRGYEADALHGDVTQPQREKILSRMKSRKLRILVATDVAARGIDITGLSHVINYSMPQNPQSYIHRVGRTGRAGLEGIAVTFLSHNEHWKLNAIRRVAGAEIRRESVPEVHQVMGAKKKRLFRKLMSALESGAHEGFLAEARRIAGMTDPELAIAALLSMAYTAEFDESRYGTIRVSTPRAAAGAGAKKRPARPAGGPVKKHAKPFAADFKKKKKKY